MYNFADKSKHVENTSEGFQGFSLLTTLLSLTILVVLFALVQSRFVHSNLVFSKVRNHAETAYVQYALLQRANALAYLAKFEPKSVNSSIHFYGSPILVQAGNHKSIVSFQDPSGLLSFEGSDPRLLNKLFQSYPSTCAEPLKALFDRNGLKSWGDFRLLISEFCTVSESDILMVVTNQKGARQLTRDTVSIKVLEKLAGSGTPRSAAISSIDRKFFRSKPTEYVVLGLSFIDE